MASVKKAVNPHDLLITAMEGGIGYWASKAEYEWEDDAEGNTTVKPVTILECWDEPDDVTYRNRPISAENILDALEKMQTDMKLPPHIRAMAFGLCNDPDYDYDVIDADVVFQYALFGEIIFG